MADDNLIKATLIYENPIEGPPVRFALNPSEYSVSATADWKSDPAKTYDAPKSEFNGTHPRTLSMTIQFIDEWAGVECDVLLETQLLERMTLPTALSKLTNKPAPPTLRFIWGGGAAFFSCHLVSVRTTYTMFDVAGIPIRATAAIELREDFSDPLRQNPTSGGPGGARAHVVSDGDTLHSIAWREYEDASLWRGLADSNGIDDPMRLAIGRWLLIPPRAQAAARS
jgi:Contractile injection system tube protein